MSLTLEIRSGINTSPLQDILRVRPTVSATGLSITSRGGDNFALSFSKASDGFFSNSSLTYDLYISYQNNITTLLDTLRNGILVSSNTDVTQLSATGLNDTQTVWASVVARNPAYRRRLYQSIEVTYGLDTPVLTAANTVDTILVDWTAISGATGYEARLNSGTPVDIPSATEYMFTGLESGQSFLIEVRAYSATQFSDWVPINVQTDAFNSSSESSTYSFNS